MVWWLREEMVRRSVLHFKLIAFGLRHTYMYFPNRKWQITARKCVSEERTSCPLLSSHACLYSLLFLQVLIDPFTQQWSLIWENARPPAKRFLASPLFSSPARVRGGDVGFCAHLARMRKGIMCLKIRTCRKICHDIIWPREVDGLARQVPMFSEGLGFNARGRRGPVHGPRCNSAVCYERMAALSLDYAT